MNGDEAQRLFVSRERVAVRDAGGTRRRWYHAIRKRRYYDLKGKDRISSIEISASDENSA